MRECTNARMHGRGRRFVRAFVHFCILALMIAGASCTRARAKTTPDGPPLEVPAPPPRDVEPNGSEPPQPVSLPSEPARNAPPRTRPPATPPSREQPRVDPRPAETARPEPPPVPPAEPPKPPEEPPKPPGPTLQTTPPNAEVDVERVIRTTIARANSDLNRIDYRALNADARMQYDQAKSLINQADRALRAKNLVFARSLADKAAALAAQLGGK